MRASWRGGSRHLPQRHVAPVFHLSDEAAAALADGSDQRHAGVEQRADGFDERGREAFHLADLVDQIDGDPRANRQRGARDGLERVDVHPILADARRVGTLHVRKGRAPPVEGDQGKAAAAALGEAFRRIGVPVGKVYTSRFNRAYETATLAGFKQAEKVPELTDAGPGMLPGESAAQTEAFRKLLGTTPQPGTNTILVTHKPNIVDALGKDWSEVKDGEASIFRPANGNYTLVARVQIDEWPRIAAAK